MSIRTTIHLQEEVYEKLQQLAKSRKRSHFINQVLAEKLQQLEEQEIFDLMKEGYLATRKERACLNRDWQTVDIEGWPQ